MIELLGSHVKEKILLYLGLRGSASGRYLARKLQISPSQIYKALSQLEEAEIILKSELGYKLNSDYIYFSEINSMLHKRAMSLPKRNVFLPHIPEERKVNPSSIYAMLALRPKLKTKYKKFSDAYLEKIHARSTD